MVATITWTPRSNSQRSALARFAGVAWELTPGHGSQSFSGTPCRMVNPVGFRHESRWIAADQINTARPSFYEMLRATSKRA